MRLTADLQRYVEFTGGMLEVLAKPTDQHQRAVGDLLAKLDA